MPLVKVPPLVEVAAIIWMITLWLDKRLTALVLGDVREQSVLDAVPFACADRQMDVRHGEACLAGEALQLTFPQTVPAADGSADTDRLWAPLRRSSRPPF